MIGMIKSINEKWQIWFNENERTKHKIMNYGNHTYSFTLEIYIYTQISMETNS